jgi:Tol biopolymer transport system component
VAISTDVSTDAIRAQLDRILVSPGFVHSDRMVRFLRFTVEETLDRRAESLKESVIGVEVFDKTPSFDPRTDTIVRVEARRLRAKLEEYYERHGREDLIRIDLPKGSYVPTFAPMGTAVEPPARPAKRSVWATVALGAIGLIGVTVGVLWWRQRAAAPTSVEWRLRPLTADGGWTTTPAISADGRLVAYASDRASQGTNLDLWVQLLSDQSQPVRLTWDSSDDMYPTFSPDGGQIAFFSSREGGGIYVIPALGGRERLLVRGGRRPRFSPDGRWIAYSTGVTGYLGESSVFMVPAGGGPPQRIAADIQWAGLPVWSPDGRRLLVLGAPRMLDADAVDFWLVSPQGGASVKTGLASRLQARQVPMFDQEEDSGFSPDWIGDALFFGKGSSIWTVPFANGVPGELRRVASGTSAIVGVLGSASRLVFEGRASASHLWELPLEASLGRVLGVMKPLPHAGGNQSKPASSSDGSRLVYSQSGPKLEELRMRATSSGVETVLGAVGGRAKISPDGTRVAYITGLRGPLFLMESTGGETTKRWDPPGGGALYGWTADGARLVYWDGPPPRFWLFDLATRQRSELISHPTEVIYGAELSPDGKWVAFHMTLASAHQIKIASVRNDKAASEREWITITAAAGANRRPWWSPDGNLLYFLSTRDESECIWAQPLDPATKRPRGDPRAVHHFHGERRRIARGGSFGPAMGGGRLVFALGDLTGNVWLAEPDRVQR